MSNVWHIDYIHITLRIVSAMILGGVVGWERERSHRAAGFRTHILVSLGASLIMILSIYGFQDFADEPNVRIDPARLAAQVISGIGFLGAGAIMVRGISITGLTTAASLWVVAAIGLASGAGFYYAAALVTILVWVSLVMLNRMELKLFASKKPYYLKIKTESNSDTLQDVTAVLAKREIHMQKISIQQDYDENELNKSMEIAFVVQFPDEQTKIQIINELRKIRRVIRITVE
ncbi:MAG: hypothetical protein A2189_08405 [Paenibacillus sp. RIFOXYA1_FULL_44_5]|nr:MAG: hypothetical protein A2189_08405 [Paenibacillus sp. RIFOXYA1_FULL_44_5]